MMRFSVEPKGHELAVARREPMRPRPPEAGEEKTSSVVPIMVRIEGRS